MKTKSTPPQVHFGAPNQCLNCRLYIQHQCRWNPGDYCKITKSR